MELLLMTQVYCLPDGYEVEDRSLEVIRYVLNPTFKPEEVNLRRLLLLILQRCITAAWLQPCQKSMCTI